MKIAMMCNSSASSRRRSASSNNESSIQAAILLLLALLTLGGMAGCGGGGGGTSSGSAGAAGAAGGSSSSGGSGTNAWTPGVFQPESAFAAKCAAPRSGTDPITHAAYPDVQGSSVDENNWLRSWTNDLYLWYSEVPDLNPASYATADYFPLLKTSATTSSNAPKDKFHYTYATSVWESLSQSNVDVGYGVQWFVVQGVPPRSVVVAFVEPGSAAAGSPANIARGASVLTIDGVDLVNAADQASVDKLNAGLSPTSIGETHTFSIRDLGSTTTRVVTLQAANVTENPVPTVTTIPTATGPVGYLLFNDQLAEAETGLITAVNTLKTAGVTDLVLDIRYNGGGYLDIASELAYMIAGPNSTAGQTFEQLRFNDKHPITDPVTGQPITPTPFHTTALGFSAPMGAALPTLNLPRVYVLTTSGTCSASESVVNGLQGVGVQVIQIGTTTCGKPYGFYPADNCGTTYFSIQFQGVNARGFGDYPDGFSPGVATGPLSGVTATLPGCSVDDDFEHALGDANESLLYVALGYRMNQACSVPPVGSTPSQLKAQKRAGGFLLRSPVRESRILRR
jgi:carboxyl-terminal processing protease